MRYISRIEQIKDRIADLKWNINRAEKYGRVDEVERWKLTLEGEQRELNRIQHNIQEGY